MIDENYYRAWSSSVSAGHPEESENLDNAIKAFIKVLSAFYGLLKIEDEMIEAIGQFIFGYVSRFPGMKIMDLSRAVELHRSHPPLNKLTPAYFEDIFEKYRKSSERAELISRFNLDPVQHKKQIAAPEKKKPSPEELLEVCRYNWKKTGEIVLNSGAVFVLNETLITETLGAKSVENIIETTVKNLTEEYTKKSTEHHNPAIRDHFRSLLESLEKKGGIYVAETRRALLRAYFEKNRSKT